MMKWNVKPYILIHSCDNVGTWKADEGDLNLKLRGCRCFYVIIP